MALYLYYVYMIVALQVMLGGAWFAIKRERYPSIICSVLGIAFLIVCMRFADQDAVAQGFDGKDDMASAHAAGISDPTKWKSFAEKKAQEKGLQDALDNASLLAVQYVHNVLKDPWSATILPSPARLVGDHIVVCGVVNAKNGFGAYTGNKAFQVIVDTGQVQIEGADGSSNRFPCT